MRSSLLTISDMTVSTSYSGTAGSFTIGTSSAISGDLISLFSNDTGYYAFSPLNSVMLHEIAGVLTIVPLTQLYSYSWSNFQILYINTPALNDRYRWIRPIKAGTYNNIIVMYNGGSGRGQYQLYIDNVSVSSSIDMSTSGGSRSTTISGVTISTNGWHTIDIKVTAAGSVGSGYSCALMLIEFH